MKHGACLVERDMLRKSRSPNPVAQMGALGPLTQDPHWLIMRTDGATLENWYLSMYVKLFSAYVSTTKWWKVKIINNNKTFQFCDVCDVRTLRHRHKRQSGNGRSGYPCLLRCQPLFPPVEGLWLSKRVRQPLCKR